MTKRGTGNDSGAAFYAHSYRYLQPLEHVFLKSR